MAREDILKTVNRIDPKKVDEIILGTWTLKDIIAHLTGWVEYQIGTIEALKSRTKPPDFGSVQDYNQKSTDSRKSFPWDKVYEEYKEKSQQLVDDYKNLTKELWKKPIEKGGKLTMEKLIKIETRHYAKTHLPQIKQLLLPT